MGGWEVWSRGVQRVSRGGGRRSGKGGGEEEGHGGVASVAAAARCPALTCLACCFACDIATCGLEKGEEAGGRQRGGRRAAHGAERRGWARARSCVNKRWGGV